MSDGSKSLEKLGELFGVLVVVAVCVLPAKAFWNVFCPQVFGWPPLTYWQACGAALVLVSLTNLLGSALGRAK